MAEHTDKESDHSATADQLLERLHAVKLRKQLNSSEKRCGGHHAGESSCRLMLPCLTGQAGGAGTTWHTMYRQHHQYRSIHTHNVTITALASALKQYTWSNCSLGTQGSQPLVLKWTLGCTPQAITDCHSLSQTVSGQVSTSCWLTWHDWVSTQILTDLAKLGLIPANCWLTWHDWASTQLLADLAQSGVSATCWLTWHLTH